MTFHRLLAIILILFIPAIIVASDPVAELQKKLNSGAVTFKYHPQRGYLDSLLTHLNVPISSQTLVFSKTSLQSERISPKTPRAMYFNDDVYVGWVKDTPLIEIMSVDPQLGAAFYLIGQRPNEKPEFERSTGHECSICHHSREAVPKFAPRLLFTSVLPDATGNVEGTFPIPTNDQSPMEERWGGWYVTGTHGTQRHLGNIIRKTPSSAFEKLPAADFASSLNITDLKARFDSSSYLSPHSDIVALMVLAHQVEIHNLIAIAAAKTDKAPREVGEPLVKAMLFAGAEPLTAPVRGTSNFATEFAGRGPKDSKGRSLREFDLKTRLFRYPLSYLIYTSSFDGLPDAVKTYVNRRLREVLSGQDKSADFAHLSAADRSAILEILRETKKE
jgi:hypothetical protein